MYFRYSAHTNRWHVIAALALAALLIGGCAGKETPSTEVPLVSTPSPVSGLVPVVLNEIYVETGTASWYGKELQGKKTASNEVFDQEGISAAHRTLPFGTEIRVINLDNKKSIKVRVNDRGPFIKSRALELSYGAAKKLDFVGQGTARVQIETLDPVQGPFSYTVQAGMYTEEENAKTVQYRLSRKFGHVTLVPRDTNLARFFCVRVGAYVSAERAEQMANKLRLEGLEPIILKND